LQLKNYTYICIGFSCESNAPGRFPAQRQSDMKAKQNKNGEWTITGIKSNEIVAISEMIQFGKECEMGYGYHIEEMRAKINDIRDREVWSKCTRLEFLLRCLSDEINK